MAFKKGILDKNTKEPDLFLNYLSCKIRERTMTKKKYVNISTKYFNLHVRWTLHCMITHSFRRETKYEKPKLQKGSKNNKNPLALIKYLVRCYKNVKSNEYTITFFLVFINQAKINYKTMEEGTEKTY